MKTTEFIFERLIMTEATEDTVIFAQKAVEKMDKDGISRRSIANTVINLIHNRGMSHEHAVDIVRYVFKKIFNADITSESIV